MTIAAERAIDGLDRLIDRIMLILFLLIFLIGCYFVSDVGYVFYNASLGYIHIQKPTAEETSITLADLSDEAIAWLTLDDTKIDYPIMHCEDNNKYLNMGADGEYNMAGAIFMDSRNDGSFEEEYTIIYGHHMSNDYMFGALDHFEEPKYFETHTTGTILTRDDRELKLNIFAFAILDARDEEVFTPGYENNIHDYIRNHAVLYRENNGGRVVALTTCREPGVTTRTLLFCEII